LLTTCNLVMTKLFVKTGKYFYESKINKNYKKNTF